MENSLTKSKWGGERGKAGGEEREGRWEQGEVGMGEGGRQKICICRVKKRIKREIRG